jgi:hypothetical protein
MHIENIKIKRLIPSRLIKGLIFCVKINQKKVVNQCGSIGAEHNAVILSVGQQNCYGSDAAWYKVSELFCICVRKHTSV